MERFSFRWQATHTGYHYPLEIAKRLYYGDNIPDTPSDIPAQDYWRACLEMADKWAETVNNHGGDVTVVHLPKAGFKGNTHFPFSDLNNVQIADHLSAWLKEKNLD